jgi:hypothetical protein
MLVLRREIYLFVREKDIAQIGYIPCATLNLHLADSPDCFEHENLGRRRNHVRPKREMQFRFNPVGAGSAESSYQRGSRNPRPPDALAF